MKNKIAITISLALALITALVKAQTPESPGDYKLEKDADYAQYESKVKEYVAWYIKAPLNQNEDLHKDISAFLVKWITGAPNVTVSLGEVAAPIINDKSNKYNPNMLMAYMGGVAVFELNNPNEKDEAKIETAGVKSVLELNNNNKDLLKNSKAIAKYQDLQDKGQLDKWVKDNISKSN